MVKRINEMSAAEIENNVFPRLFAPDKIEQLIEDDILHWIDYGLVITLFVTNEDGSIDLIRNRDVTDKHLDEDSLLKWAIRNVGRTYAYKTLYDLIDILLKAAQKDPANPNLDMALDDITTISRYVYVLTAGSKYGAGVILNKEVLYRVSLQLLSIAPKKLGDKVAILPSTVHEVMLIPYYTEKDLEAYYNTVVDVNHSHVEEDKLIDGVFIFDMKTKKLSRYWPNTDSFIDTDEDWDEEKDI